MILRTPPLGQISKADNPDNRESAKSLTAMRFRKDHDEKIPKAANIVGCPPPRMFRKKKKVNFVPYTSITLQGLRMGAGMLRVGKCTRVPTRTTKGAFYRDRIHVLLLLQCQTYSRTK